MRRIFQIITQVIFLTLFIALFVMGKMQLWMGLFILGIILSFILGRVFCGYCCSINTVMRFISFVKRKLHIKSLKIPKFVTRPWVRYTALGLFIAVFIFTMATGKKLPVLLVLFLLGIGLTLLFPEELWHRYLCPYGSILRIPSTKSLHYMTIDNKKCSNCGACTSVCPTSAISKNKNNHEIVKNECIVCYDCIDMCKKGAIKYK